MIVLNVSAVSPLSRRSGACRWWRLVGALLASAWLSAATSNGQSSSPVPDAPSEQADQLTWSVDPGLPGPDVPPVGHSLFDFLVAQSAAANGTEGVPFPFRALLGNVTDTLARDASGQSSIRAVLIPLGRSLQRNAAAPAYFESPRIVVAVDGEPRETPGRPALLLRDRLYLGYQPRAEVIEVISYNEAMGRFEFQVVSGYRAGGSIKVRYARRAVCMACHQNGGPIFSRGMWSETNANPAITAMLHSVKDRFEGIEVERGIDIPDAIDASVRRANRLAAYQWLWRNGCATLGASGPEVQCRAQATIAALQYRLSGSQSYNGAAPAFRDSVVGAMAASTNTQHGEGLALPDPGLPNRDPLQERARNTRFDRDYRSDANVTAVYDPLSPRAPLETWSWGQPDLLARRLVAGLSESFSDSDARRLDALLVRAARANNASRRHFAFDCDVGVAELERARRHVAFVCVTPPLALQPPARLDGALIVHGTRVESRSIDRMILTEPGVDVEALRNIAIVGGSIVTAHGGVTATFRIARDGAHVRGGDGNAVESVRLHWSGPASDVSMQSKKTRVARGVAAVTIVEDFAPILEAVAALQRDTLDGTSDALSAQPFRRASVLAAIYRRLGLASSRWCCIDDAKMASPQATETVRMAATEDGSALSVPELPFYRHCALCHRSSDSAPPNFLTGTQQQVRANLAHCAQRLYVRLAMWDHAAEGRTKTPMPPFTALRGARIGESEWRSGSDLAALRGYVAKILQEEPGKFASPEALLHTNYEHLRTCLP